MELSYICTCVCVYIIQVVADEAYASYDNSIIWRLPNDATEDLEANCFRLAAWLASRSQDLIRSLPKLGLVEVERRGSFLESDSEQDTKLN